ncbi:MAG: tRNA (adenosine(37)-N6)-threonylcarbamoyltransferase complex transferase subunit TsaD [Christensenellales bacterium]
MSYFSIAKQKFEQLKQKKDIYVLGIESSCDETGVSIVKNGREIIANIVATQIDIHKRFGGVVPEIASRNHIMQINNCLTLCLKEANMTLNDIDLISVTYGAGLIGALMVGVNFAKALAYSLNKPLIKVDHIKGHISANYLCFKDLTPPFICLLVSGAHTEILKVDDYNLYSLIGSSLDDACGECFDKVARVLNLEYPGGPKIEKLAKLGEANIKFVKENRELNHTFNFSYSGLKTAVINHIHSKKQNGEEINVPNLCASFQKQAFDELIEKTINASKMCGKDYSKIVIAGGVSANEYLRQNLQKKAEQNGLKVYFPKISLCTDNAAMVASCGYFNFLKNENLSDLTLSPKARIDV